MVLPRIVLITGFWLIICSNQISGQIEYNVTNLLNDDSLLPIKERFRRLIPYMTYYLDQGYNTQSQFATPATQQYQPIQPVSNNLQTQYNYVPQYQQQKYQLIPVGYLVGGGYRRVPVYSRPSQVDYTPITYTPQHPSDLTRTVSQNYIPTTKIVDVQSKDQRPAQYTTKLHYANQNQPQTQVYKSPSQTKTYFQQRQQPQQITQRQPFYQKRFRPNYVPLKEESYVQLHNNYDTTYETPQNVKNFEPNPEVMTITKSQEVKFPTEENPILASNPVSASLTKSQDDYEQSVPSVPTIEQNNLLELLTGYQLTKTIPERVTPSNIGYSIQTLSHILKLLQKAKAQSTESNFPIQPTEGDSYTNGVSQYSPYQTEGSTPGRAGIDYPAYAEIPETRFTCKNQRYKGFFGDPETNCQVWHYCDLNGGQASFLCPNGTIFSQVALTCDWWFNVKCASTAQLYVLNERLYKYILPVKPSFPEDYAGPLVDEYLTHKFRELEAKKQNTTTTEKPPSTLQVLLNDEVNQAVK